MATIADRFAEHVAGSVLGALHSVERVKTFPIGEGGCIGFVVVCCDEADLSDVRRSVVMRCAGRVEYRMRFVGYALLVRHVGDVGEAEEAAWRLGTPELRRARPLPTGLGRAISRRRMKR